MHIYSFGNIVGHLAPLHSYFANLLQLRFKVGTIAGKNLVSAVLTLIISVRNCTGPLFVSTLLWPLQG
jgi:hypothetical protein